MNDSPVTEVGAKVLAAARDWGARPDQPEGALIEQMVSLSSTLDARMADFVKEMRHVCEIPADVVVRTIESAARVSLARAASATIRGWTWRRWTYVAAAGAVALLTAGVAGWLLHGALIAQESAAWIAWCLNKDHIKVVSGAQFCLVPMGK